MPRSQEEHSRPPHHARRSSVSSLALAAILCLGALLSPAPVESAQDANPVLLRIGVVKDGITVLAPADLAGAGVDPASVDPRSFALSSLGQPVAIYVTGEADGAFDGADRLYFFGEKFRGPEMDQKYTDERVYWLTIGGSAGPRMASNGAEPEYDLTPPTHFAMTLRAEESTQWWSRHTQHPDTEDTWFWARLWTVLVGPGQAVTGTLPYTVPDPAPGAGAAFRFEAISRSHSPSLNPDHRTTIAFNGKPLVDQTWDGLRVRKVFAANLAPGEFVHGVNTVEVGAWNLPGLSIDDVYANYWELDYRRLFRAYEGRLDFRAESGGTQEYEIGNWDTPFVWIWDVSNPQQPERLTLTAPAMDNKLYFPVIGVGDMSAGGSAAAAVEPAGNVSVRFRATGAAGSRYWLQAMSTFQAPASIRLRTPTGLRQPSGGADSVIVTSAELRPAAEQLAQWHTAHGRRALVVDIQDVYDEFNDGIYHPKALQAMLKWAVANWQAPAPAYLTLFGDGHWNFKGYNPAAYPPQPNHIPPYLAWEDPWQGEVPVDALFGDTNDDGVPEVAVGRLAVNTPAEAQTVVGKIVNYDENVRTADWQRRALFVADNPDVAGDFPSVSEEMIAGYTPSDLQIVRAYLPGSPPTTEATLEQIAETRATIANTLQSGAFMVQFTGHGAPERWTHELIWRSSDIAALTNGSRLPVVLTFNCLDGYFVHPAPSTHSIAELMQRHAGGGSVAAISPAGLGTTPDQEAFRKILLNVMFKDNVREIGRALTVAKQQFHQLYGNHYLIATMTLFGDPAMQLPAAGTPTAGNNLAANGEFTSDVAGYTEGWSTIAWRDSSATPGAASTNAGAADTGVLELTDAGGSSYSLSQNTLQMANVDVSKWYRVSGLVYAPSQNVVANAGRLVAGRTPLSINYVDLPVTTEDAWQALAATFRLSFNTPTWGLHAGVGAAAADGDKVYLDALRVQELSLGRRSSFRATADSNVDISVKIRISAAYSWAGLWVNTDDPANPQNGVLVVRDRTRVQVLKYLGGTSAVMYSGSIPYVDGATLRVSKNGNQYTFYYNGVELETLTMWDAVITTNTYHGTFATTDDATLDDFSVTQYASGLGARTVYPWGNPDFTVIYLPDTQYQVTYYPEHAKTLANWIVATKDTLRTLTVLHVGDTSEGPTTGEWQNADAMFDILDAGGIPYLVAQGNHEGITGYAPGGPFAPARYTSLPWWNGGFYDTNSTSSYSVLTVGGRGYLFLNLNTGYPLAAPPAAVQAWANSILTTHADKDTWVVMHAYLDQTGNIAIPDLWNNVFKWHANIVWIGNGHYDTPTVHTAQSTNGGRTVNVAFAAYHEDADDQNTGYLRVCEVYLAANQVKVYTYSPTKDRFLTDATNQFTVAYKGTS